MFRLTFTLLFFVCISLLQADDPKLWSEGKITPDQPFKAKVVGVQPGWGWDTIILREKGEGRYCLATFGNPFGTYKVVGAKDFDQAKMIKLGTVFLQSGVEVGRFSWSMGIWKHGKIFGEEDSAAKYFRALTKAENKSE